MNWQDALMAMLPEHLLLAGIVLLLAFDSAARPSRGRLAVALCAVGGASVAALL